METGGIFDDVDKIYFIFKTDLDKSQFSADSRELTTFAIEIDDEIGMR
jgi:hypothetical protein